MTVILAIKKFARKYDAYIISGDNRERIGCGSLGQLIGHLPQFKNLSLDGSPGNFKLEVPHNLRDVTWFTKTTVMRFLLIIDSEDALRNVSAICSELSQLEEARRFHLSLYSKGHDDSRINGEKDSSNNLASATSIKKAENRPQSLDDSKYAFSSLRLISVIAFMGLRFYFFSLDYVPLSMKMVATRNELLRAMDLRVTTLRCELVSAFNHTAQSIFSVKDITNIKNFCEHFGVENLRKLVLILLEMNQRDQAVDHSADIGSSFTCNLRNGVKQTEEDCQKGVPSSHVKPVIYSGSPAKVAQAERKSSTESEESSYSSDEETPRAERSRTLTRSAAPRRSASPMRRVQIGRSSSRRTPALAIKSLNYNPGRERTFCYRDAAPNDSEVEESGKLSKTFESNVKRISVQDAISLFESKQRNQATNTQEKISIFDNAANTKKSVLRRWSAGMGESSVKCLAQDTPECTAPALVASDSERKEIASETVEMNERKSPPSVESQPVENTKRIEKYEVTEACNVSPNVADVHDCPIEETEAGVDHNEWNQQKEAELNQLLMQLVENKPVQYNDTKINGSMNNHSGSQQISGFADQDKDRRDEKPRENSGKKAEKPVHLKSMQKVVDKTNVGTPSSKAVDAGKKESGTRINKIAKNVSQAASYKKEPPKPASVERKASSKTLPAARKSWPSTPSSRTTGTLPAKTPAGISPFGPAVSRQKAPMSTSNSRSGPKVERSQVLQKDVKKIQADMKRSSKSAVEKQQTTPGGKTFKMKSPATAVDKISVVPQKPGLRNKMPKKSSVVPLKSKPPTEKASEFSPSNSPVVGLMDLPTVAHEPDGKFQDPVSVLEDEVVATACDSVIMQLPKDSIPHEIDCVSDGPEKLIEEFITNEDEEISRNLCGGGDDAPKAASFIEDDDKAEIIDMISPSSWVEIGPLVPPIPSSDNATQLALPPSVVVMEQSDSRARYSLSQMLLQEISETDATDWGVAENSATMIFQKDAPKGLKRLLKFARKSKGETNSTGGSSPHNSEGEEDDCRSLASRNSDNQQGNASLYPIKYEHQARPDTSKNTAQSSNKFQEPQGHSSLSQLFAAIKEARQDGIDAEDGLLGLH
ncbi:hypothetical protein AKJ16_DCAP08662 [Drosera capensis]